MSWMDTDWVDKLINITAIALTVTILIGFVAFVVWMTYRCQEMDEAKALRRAECARICEGERKFPDIRWFGGTYYCVCKGAYDKKL